MRIEEGVRLAVETILAHKFRSILTMLGMIIGVFAVVLLVSLGQGAKQYIFLEFQNLGTNLIVIQPGRNDQKGALTPPMGSTEDRLTLQDVEAIEKRTFQIEAVSGFMMGTGQFRWQGNTDNTSIFGVNHKFPNILNFEIAQGDFISKEEEVSARRVVVLGHTLARSLFGNEYAVGHQIRINQSIFRVIGVLEEVGSKLGLDIDLIAFVPTTTAMRLFNEDSLFGIRAKASGRASVDNGVEELRDILKERHDGNEDFTIITQGAIMGSMSDVLQVLSYLLGGIAAISMLVGGIGIMNIMWVSVTERTEEIGIRRAVGARRIDILQQFLTESLVLSIFSGIIGLGGALGLTYGAYALYPQFDARPPLWIVLSALLVSLVVGVVFGVWPAYRAAKVEALDALRYE
jgi:putative ABC transport system permease protein